MRKFRSPAPWARSLGKFQFYMQRLNPAAPSGQSVYNAYGIGSRSKCTKWRGQRPTRLKVPPGQKRSPGEPNADVGARQLRAFWKSRGNLAVLTIMSGQQLPLRALPSKDAGAGCIRYQNGFCEGPPSLTKRRLRVIAPPVDALLLP